MWHNSARFLKKFLQVKKEKIMMERVPGIQKIMGIPITPLTEICRE